MMRWLHRRREVIPFPRGSIAFPAQPITVSPDAPTGIPAAAIGEPR